MRKIEQQMVAAIQTPHNWTSGNTTVSIDKDSQGFACIANVYLYGHHIATVHYNTGEIVANRETLRQWPTVTTKSRLRALGVDVATKAGVTYLEGRPV